MEQIRVVGSKFKDDDNVPWEGTPYDFCNWVYETFLDGYKRDDVEHPDVDVAIAHLRNMGYKVEVE
jgi:hypothetical protein